MKKTVLMILTGMMCLILAGCGKSLELTAEQITVELGGSIDVDASDLVADEGLAAETVLDFSAVDVTAAGTYTATATYKEQTKEFEVVVVDTVAPVADILENATIAVGEPLYAKDLISSVTEFSGRAEVTLSVATSQPEDAAEGTETVEEETENAGTEETEDAELPALEETFNADSVTCTNDVIVFDAVGAYDLAVVIADASGNQTEAVVHVTVGETPVISGVEDMTVIVGTDAEDVDFLDGVTAVDCRGNDITADVVCDSSAVDLAKTGEYELTYTVVDADGFAATEKAVVTVEEKSSKKVDSAKNDGVKKTDSKSDSAKKNDSQTSGANDTSGSNVVSSSDNSGNDSDNGNSGNDNNNSQTSGGDSTSGNSGSAATPSVPSTDNGGSTSTPSTDNNAITVTPAPEPTPVPETPSADSGAMSVPDDVVIEDYDPSENQNADPGNGGDGGDVTWSGDF